MSILASLSVQEQQFLEAFQQALENDQFDRLILSQYKGELQQLEKMTLRVIYLHEQKVLSCLYRYKTQDVTKNYPFTEALSQVTDLLACCKQANLMTTTEELQLKKNKKKAMLTRSKNKAPIKSQAEQGHDRVKQRYVDQDSGFLQHLGITDPQGQVIPSMARKWKQINKFVEIFSNALGQITAPQQGLRVVDFGSGKGYLTCALYDYMQKHGQTPWVTGVELNPKMVEFCQNVADQSQFGQLDFFQGGCPHLCAGTSRCDDCLTCL